MNRLQLLWKSSAGKKAIMAVSGLIWVGYLITHMLANLLVFDGPTKINAYSAFLHANPGGLWAARLVLIAAFAIHIVAAAQLTGRRQAARPIGYAHGQDPQVSTIAARTIRYGGVLILVFLVYHLLHFTFGTAHPQFTEGSPYDNVVNGFRNPIVVVVYLVALAVVGLHLYHGLWSSTRSLGVSPPSPQPLKRRVAAALALFIWLGFTVIPIAVFFRVLR